MLVSSANPAGSRNLSPPASFSYWQFCWPGIFSSLRQQRFWQFIYLPFPPVLHHTVKNEIQFWQNLIERLQSQQLEFAPPVSKGLRDLSSPQPRDRSALNFLFFPTVQWEVLPKPMFRFRQKVSDLDFHTFTSGGCGVSWCHICSVVLVRLLIMHFFFNPTKQWQIDFGRYFLLFESTKTLTYAKNDY